MKMDVSWKEKNNVTYDGMHAGFLMKYKEKNLIIIMLKNYLYLHDIVIE